MTHILANQLHRKRKNTSLIFYTLKFIVYYMLKTDDRRILKKRVLECPNFRHLQIMKRLYQIFYHQKAH